MNPDPHFPPGDLPRIEGRYLRWAYELAFRKPHVGAPTEVERGVTTTSAVRKIGPLEIRIEMHATVPPPEVPGPTTCRIWAWIWHDGTLVFDAWCWRAETGAKISLVQKCETGEWTFHLRVAHERDERI